MNKENSDIMKAIENIFLDTFSEDNYQFSLDTTNDDIEEWDSLGHIRLLTAIEAEFNFQFDISEIELLSSVSFIVKLVTKKIS
jgi:acyl carrier protein